ncbi:MAG: DUF507 family protein [Bdellovibrionaceae bacterium]|nr:DUF507 family protein [Pseudobdellovibrionaceae bacterium]
MIISEQRQAHLARLLIDGLWGDELVDFDEEQEDHVVHQARRIISDWVAVQGDMDKNVRDKIQNLKRGVSEGSNEWNILYKQYLQEEMSRKGFK